MKIVPVMDILNGEVVHAVRGKRKEYQPLRESAICPSSSPFAVASAFAKCGFREPYIADLDAIAGKLPNSGVIRQIADSLGLSLMVDAGISDLEKAEQILNCNASKIIIGTETLSDMGFVRAAVERFGKERVVVSLDLVNGKVLSRSAQIKLMDPVALAGEIQDAGVAQIIVLDLARVGSGEGIDLPLLQEISRNTHMRLFAGGGVREMDDLLRLKKAGVDGVLLATALHNGKISPSELRKHGLL